MEDQYLAARQQGRDHLKRGILRGGADEDQGAVLHVGEEGVLLRLVEVMDFVDKEHRGFPQAMEPLGLFDEFFQLLDAGGDGREMDAMGASGTAQDLRQGGFSAPRRTPENERMELASIDHLAEQFPWAEQMPLADKLLQV